MRGRSDRMSERLLDLKRRKLAVCLYLQSKVGGSEKHGWQFFFPPLI